jgi:hypothetical protein
MSYARGAFNGFKQSFKQGTLTYALFILIVLGYSQKNFFTQNKKSFGKMPNMMNQQFQMERAQ